MENGVDFTPFLLPPANFGCFHIGCPFHILKGIDL